MSKKEEVKMVELRLDFRKYQIINYALGIVNGQYKGDISEAFTCTLAVQAIVSRHEQEFKELLAMLNKLSNTVWPDAMLKCEHCECNNPVCCGCGELKP